jgi:hypothetical protein
MLYHNNLPFFSTPTTSKQFCYIMDSFKRFELSLLVLGFIQFIFIIFVHLYVFNSLELDFDELSLI